MAIVGQVFNINGFEFAMSAGMGDGDGVIIHPDDATQLDNPEYITSVKIAMALYQDFYDYAYANNAYEAYVPRLREVPAFAEHHRELFVDTLVKQNRQIVAQYRALQPHHESMIVQPETNHGYIYLLRALEPEGHYKIGYSARPIKRIATMGVKLPYPVKVLHLIKTNDMKAAEQQLHERYAKKRVNGEWFRLTEKDIQDICAIEYINIETSF